MLADHDVKYDRVAYLDSDWLSLIDASVHSAIGSCMVQFEQSAAFGAHQVGAVVSVAV